MSNEQSTAPSTGRTTRRTVARGMAWAVPVVAVGAAAPAYAASRTIVVTNIGVCNTANSTSSTGGTITVTLGTPLPAGQTLPVSFARTGTLPTTSTLSVTGGPGISGTYPNFNLTGDGVRTVFTFTVTNLIPGSGNGASNTLTATVGSTPKNAVVGDTQGTLMITRDGNSNNYKCAGN